MTICGPECGCCRHIGKRKTAGTPRGRTLEERTQHYRQQRWIGTEDLIRGATQRPLSCAGRTPYSDRKGSAERQRPSPKPAPGQKPN